jgi:predicted RNA binding protein YcfA (HicA-like mRNA interferase family)
MPKLPPIKAINLVKILERQGFRRIRQKGSHLILKHVDGRETVIPMHRGEEIGRGLLRKILREINLTVNGYQKLK